VRIACCLSDHGDRSPLRTSFRVACH
jgi:hypothetical protein